MPDIVIKDWPAILLAFTGAVVVTRFFIPSLIKVVNERNLTDKPGKHKIHKQEIPTLGGIAIFGGFTFGYLLGVDSLMSGVSYFSASVMILFFTGLKDDLIILSPWKKLISEVGAALIITFFTDLRFTNLHGFMGAEEIPVWSSYLLTIFLVVLIINAFNLIDGVDGLATSIGIIASLIFGAWFWLSGDYGYAIMAVSLLGALIIFLRFNLSSGPRKIFMGDSGSLVIGFIMAVFAIRFNENNASGNGFLPLYSSPSVSMSILIVPLYDTLRVIILRLRDHQNLFDADNRHVHHLMLRAGFTHLQTTIIISSFNIGIIILAFLFDFLGIFWLTVLLLTLCIIASTVLSRFVRWKEAHLPEVKRA